MKTSIFLIPNHYFRKKPIMSRASPWDGDLYHRRQGRTDGTADCQPTSKFCSAIITPAVSHVIFRKSITNGAMSSDGKKPPDRFCVAQFLWQEGHTIHATEAEARKRPRHSPYIIKLNRLLAIPLPLERRLTKKSLPVPRNLCHRSPNA